MKIEGPPKISVLETPGEGGWEWHIDFRDEFRLQEPGEQGQRRRAYRTGLEIEDRNPQGMLLVQQSPEQSLPHLEAGEIAQAPVASLQGLTDSSRI